MLSFCYCPLNISLIFQGPQIFFEILSRILVRHSMVHERIAAKYTIILFTDLWTKNIEFCPMQISYAFLGSRGLKVCLLRSLACVLRMKWNWIELNCRLYAKYLMTDSVKVELQCMRNGLHKMIPKQLLDPLTPEVPNFIFQTLYTSREVSFVNFVFLRVLRIQLSRIWT